MHAPNARRMDPVSGTKNAHVEQGSAAAIADAAVGPCEPRYQRSAAALRPSGPSNRSRPKPSSQIATVSSSASSVISNPGTNLESLSISGNVIEGSRSPGRIRSAQGIHDGANRASSAGTKCASHKVASRPRGGRATVTAHTQPR